MLKDVDFYAPQSGREARAARAMEADAPTCALARMGGAGADSATAAESAKRKGGRLAQNLHILSLQLWPKFKYFLRQFGLSRFYFLLAPSLALQENII